eukprot:Colp12_sorted_trinity150504_noHs@21918
MLAASCGEIASCTIRVPTEVIKQRMQAGVFSTTLETIKGTYSEGGIRGFYRGYFTTIAREIPFAFIQFPLYELAKQKVNAMQGSECTPWQASLCGSAAGGFSAAVTTPLDVVKTRIMLSKGATPTWTGTFQQVYSEGGVSGLFRGVVPRTMWISIGGCVFFGAYETSKRYLFRQ